MFSVAQASWQVDDSSQVDTSERRGDPRVRTIFRVAVLKTASDEGLCRITNISDGGARLQTGMSLTVSQSLLLAISGATSIPAKVVWKGEGSCGVRFDEPMNCFEVLHQSYEAHRTAGFRAPRLNVTKRAVVSGEPGLVPVKVCDVSQRGMKIIHDSSFKPGMRLKVLLESGRECRGVIRWSTDTKAGIWLMDQFAPEELSSAASL